MKILVTPLLFGLFLGLLTDVSFASLRTNTQTFASYFSENCPLNIEKYKKGELEPEIYEVQKNNKIKIYQYSCNQDGSDYSIIDMILGHNNYTALILKNNKKIPQVLSFDTPIFVGHGDDLATVSSIGTKKVELLSHYLIERDKKTGIDYIRSFEFYPENELVMMNTWALAITKRGGETKLVSSIVFNFDVYEGILNNDIDENDLRVNEFVELFSGK